MELLIVIIVLALLFDFTNGFHDAANSIATVVTTGALRPKVAVVFAAILNFAGAFIAVEVAATIAKGIVDPTIITLQVIMAGLIGAITWNYITWWKALPSSSSHALIGGMIGSVLAAVGFGAVDWSNILSKVVEPSILAPTIAIIVASILMVAFRYLSAKKYQNKFKYLQLISAGFVSLTHGTNDAQKTMGIIVLALLTYQGTSEFHLPLWVIIVSGLAIAIGTYAGGWRIIRTLGQKITVLKPVQGFVAETTTASILFVAANQGFPLSTTHTITGSIVGVGAKRKTAKRFPSVNWKITGNILIAWVLTIPMAASIGAGIFYLTLIPGGAIIALVLVLALLVMAFRTREKVSDFMVVAR